MGTRVVGIASGKGGVGKTTLIVNLALQLNEFGKKVLIFDADLGMANVHLAFSKSISHDLSDVIDGTVSLEETIVSLSEGIDLIPGGSGVADIADLDEMGVSSIVRAFSGLEGQYDYLLVDMSAGISTQVLTFLSCVHLKIVVGTDELGSISDAYSLIKVHSKHHDMDDLIYLPNRVSSPKEGKKLFESVNYVTTKFLKKDLEYIGSISEDPLYCRVWESSRPKGNVKSSSNAFAELSAVVSEIEKHSAFNSEEGSKGLSFFLDGFTS